MKLILECPDELVEPETIALGINLACSEQSAQLMCKGPGLKLLMRRVLKTQDALLLKMIRNISQHPGPTKRLFLVCVHYDLFILLALPTQPRCSYSYQSEETRLAYS